MKRFRVNLVALLAALLLFGGCIKHDDNQDRLMQNTLDTAWGISYLTGYLFNGYIASRPAGNQDVTVHCSNGGSIRIAGWTGYDKHSALLSMDLTYEFVGAHASVIATNLDVTFHPLNGAIRQSGTMRVGGEFMENSSATSTGMVYDVTIVRPDTGAEYLTNSGPYELTNWTATNGADRIYHNMDGELDGIPFSWSYCASASCSSNYTYYYVYVEL